MDFTPYISRIDDPQNGVYLATQGCASFSLMHECNIDLNMRMRASGIPLAGLDFLESAYVQGGKAFLSTRYETVMSGTGLGGNSDVNTNVSLDRDGAAPESAYTFDMSARSPADLLGRDAYFTPPSPQLVSWARELLTHFTPSHFSVGTSHQAIVAGLQKHPVRVFVGISKGWSTQAIVADTGAAMNHAVLVVNVDPSGNYVVQDQFAPYLKTLDKSFKIYAAFQTYLTPTGAHAMYSKVVKRDGTTFGVMVTTPNGVQIIYATTADQWVSWSKPDSYQISSANQDGTPNFSTADCTQLPF